MGKDTTKKGRIGIIWGMFVGFCVLFAFLTLCAGNQATSFSWLLLELWVLILDVILLVRYKFPSKKFRIISLVLALLVSVSYIDTIIVTGNMGGIFNVISTFTVTLASGMASFRVFEEYPERKLWWIRKDHSFSPVISILIGIVCGCAWGALNYFLMVGNNSASFQPSIHCILISLSPAILEELAMRTVFYAYCIHLLGGEHGRKGSTFTCWFMMIMPHVLVHTSESFQKGGLATGLITILLYVLIFGIIFAILQKKRDLCSAMIAHGIVDAIRFTFFALPF